MFLVPSSNKYFCSFEETKAIVKEVAAKEAEEKAIEIEAEIIKKHFHEVWEEEELTAANSETANSVTVHSAQEETEFWLSTDC